MCKSIFLFSIIFFFYLKDFFNFSYLLGLPCINSFRFYISAMLFNSPSFLKDTFTGYRILVMSFRTLKGFSCYLLPCVVSDKKSAVSLPLFLCNLFPSLAVFKIFSLWLILSSWILMHLLASFPCVFYNYINYINYVDIWGLGFLSKEKGNMKLKKLIKS